MRATVVGVLVFGAFLLFIGLRASLRASRTVGDSPCRR
jgi:hypothetical protein